MIRAWLRNPWETAAVAVLGAASAFSLYGLVAAASLFVALEIIAGLRKAEEPRWWPSLWPRASGSLTVLYDATCVLCTRSKERLEKWATADSMEFLSLQSTEARALLPEMDEKSYLGALHVVEGGRIFTAHEGWFRIMRLAPLPLALAAALTPAWLARPLYVWVARNRYRWFGRVCDSGTCAVHPGDRL